MILKYGISLGIMVYPYSILCYSNHVAELFQFQGCEGFKADQVRCDREP